MKRVRVLQLGTEDFSKLTQVSDCVEWYYEPDFSKLPEQYFDVVILDREITEDEFDFLLLFLRAYCLFITENVPLKNDGRTYRLFVRKMGRRVSSEELESLLKDKVLDYFSGSYGEKFNQENLSVSQRFQGSVSWRGFEGVDLNGNYGKYFRQIVFWRNNIPIEGRQTIELWLEYTKDDTVELSLEVMVLPAWCSGVPESQTVLRFSEEELNHIVHVENKYDRMSYLFISVQAKGHGRLTVTALHDRHSRRGKGYFIPGGRRAVTSEREEIFYYFDPGNLKPPLNVYFSGYKTREGFEGYYMMRERKHPFLLITDVRLEGGCFYLGSEEYENTVEKIIRKHMKSLGFKNSEVLFSGLSMGAFGALYYGCRICPNTILVGKPLASIGSVAENEMLRHPGEFPAALDVLHKVCGSLDQAAVRRLNQRFWDAFDHTDWSGTRFAVAYMIEDDYDGTAYEELQSHLKNAGAKVYGKGLHGRHNDNTAGIVDWFISQYQSIIQNEFVRARMGTDGRK